jgi:plasmid stabilization system protein ParE
MIKEVVLTPIALADLDIVSYLARRWGQSVVDNFIELFENKLQSLAQNPGIYKFIDGNKQRQMCHLTKHNIIYFMEMEFSIKILTIFDTRQDPEKLSFII